LQGGGRHRDLFLGCEQFVVKLVGDGDEMPRGFARGRPVAGQGLVRRAEQGQRMRGDLGGTQRFQQLRRQRPAARRFDQVTA
jgi:hypothetical protein